MGRELQLSDLRQTIADALSSENPCRRTGMAKFEWDVAGNCENPQWVELYARPAGKRVYYRTQSDGTPQVIPHDFGEALNRIAPETVHMTHERHVLVRRGTQHPLWLVLETRCRKCPACLRARAAMWRRRAMEETKHWPRTWLVTLTLSAHNHFLVAGECALADAPNGVWETRPHSEQFAMRVARIGPEITRWLKRVRKNSGAPMRYLLVAEEHKSGLPHFHALVHECDAARPVRHKVLTDAWTWGFTNVKLVKDPQQSGYPCKYLMKSALARVRASVQYGGCPIQTLSSIGPLTVNKRPLPTRETCPQGAEK